MSGNTFLTGDSNTPLPFPDGYPDWVTSGDGAHVYDADGTAYVDLWMGFGALPFGHADPEVAAAAEDRLDDGWFFSNPSATEREVAELLHETIPCAESVRFATSGSDAVAYAARAARAYTGRERILTVAGGFHGIHDGFLPSDGIVDDRREKLTFGRFNDLDAMASELGSGEYAAVVLEPALANAGCTPPADGFLQGLRECCDETDTLLIFDEVVTGFRLAPGGAQERFGVEPDLATFSKAIAGGFPLSAICGRDDVMREFMASGDVMFAGTFNAHPVSLAAAKSVVTRLRDDDVQAHLDALGERFRSFLRDEATALDATVAVQGIGSMTTAAFGVDSFPHGLAVDEPDEERYRAFIEAAAEQGLLMPPLATETVFLSPVHEPMMDEIEDGLAAALRAAGG